MIPRSTGPPDWNYTLEDLVDLTLVLGLTGLMLWSVILGTSVSSFRPPVPQREVFQIAHIDRDWDRTPVLSRLQL